jgi:hypothetical protein
LCLCCACVVLVLLIECYDHSIRWREVGGKSTENVRTVSLMTDVPAHLFNM